ncbi:DnaJ subfamily C member 25 [Cichlidogyrus casuarinus]|uniref:DnaJ subfamily C member 25 n=1 Tax=Cichlidogyrus casuarinus TaxID=1844966 RepID=A0ABD2QHG3_9PLAT
MPKMSPKKVSADQKEEAEKNFKRISQAYEVLRDAEQRKEYDYMLDNPSEMYFNYYQYYKRRLTPKVDVRIVIVSIILVLSILHYVGQVTNYNLGLNYLVRDPKHRKKAEEIATNEGKMSFKRHQNGVRLSKDKIKAIEDQIIRNVLTEHFTLRGSCEKPSVFRTPIFLIVLLPYYFLCFIYSCARWIVKFYILKQPYDDDAQVYITRKKLGLSAVRWEGLGEEQHTQLLALKFWEPGNFEVSLGGHSVISFPSIEVS